MQPSFAQPNKHAEDWGRHSQKINLKQPNVNFVAIKKMTIRNKLFLRQEIKVDGIFVHESFNITLNKDNDIALLRLGEMFFFKLNQQLIHSINRNII